MQADITLPSHFDLLDELGEWNISLREAHDALLPFEDGVRGVNRNRVGQLAINTVSERESNSIEKQLGTSNSELSKHRKHVC